MSIAMKKMMFLTRSLPVLLAFLTLAALSFAQATTPRNDQVYLLNGEVKEGKIHAITAEAAQFTYAGETLNYTIGKNTIHKFVFSSGREEVVNQQLVKAVENLAYQENTVAVLPLFYIGDASDQKTDQMPYRLQQEVYNFMVRNARALRFQDPSETNALLLKNGVNSETIRQYTNGELAALLQVEYLITGTVTQEEGDITQYATSSSTGNTQVGKDRNRRVNVKERNHTNVITSTNLEIKTSVDLAIVNHQGQKIYNDSKRSILSSVDAYRHALHYLLRRTPLYER
jgi:hypothetical protein